MLADKHLSTRTDTAEAPFTLFNTDAAAAALGIARRTLQEFVASGELGCVKFGRSIRFTADDLAAFVERHRRKPRGWKESKGITTKGGIQ